MAKRWAFRHAEYGLEVEAAYLADLLSAVGELVDDERHPAPRKPMPM